MSNPERHEVSIANLSDDYIYDLKPESQRYDITLAKDFVISVLPNGIKTWAFIYDFRGRHRRKTLGVFPDMNFTQARLALDQARNAIVRMDEPTVAPNEFERRPAVLGGGLYVPKDEAKSDWSKSKALLTAIALIAPLAGIYYWYQQKEISAPTPTPAQDNTVPFAVAPKDTAPKNTAKENTPQVNVGVENSSAQNVQSETVPQTSETVSSSYETITSEVDRTSTADRTSQADTSDTIETTSAAISTAMGTSSPTATVEPSDATHPNAMGRGTSEPTLQESSTASGPIETSPTRVQAARATATSTGGSVPRSRLTSRVENLEPVDQLGPEISHQNSGYQRVFYFTELREFTDGVVIHRWELDGQIVHDVELKVKNAWRWRTYSNKDIPPGLTGDWTVSTIDATGAVLDSISFTYGY